MPAGPSPVYGRGTTSRRGADMARTRTKLVILAWLCAIACATLGATVLSTGTSRGEASTLFSDGFDSGDLTAWSSATGLTVEQSVVDDGASAAREAASASPGVGL